MLKNFFLLSALSLSLFACKQESKTDNASTGALPASAQSLAGHWIAMDFATRAGKAGSVLAAMNNSHKPYAYGITFVPAQADSALVFSTPQGQWLPARITDDTVELRNAYPANTPSGTSVFLVYDSQGDKSVSMFDPSPSGTHLDKYIKSKAQAKDGYHAFQFAINHQLLNGQFTPLGKGASGDKKVLFYPDGVVRGLEPAFTNYEICLGGDCLVAGQKTDVITLSAAGKENSAKPFGMRYSAKTDTLYLYNLNGAEVGSLAYSFSRQKAK